MTERGPRLAAALLTVGLFAAAPQGVDAQTVRPLSPEQIMRLTPEMQLAVKPMGDEPCAPSHPAPGEVASLTVGSLSVTGVTVFKTAEFDPIVSSMAGHAQSPEALDRAAQAVICRYRQSGYVFAHAQVVRRDGDAWRIEVNEGVLGRMEAAVDSPYLAAMLHRAFSGLSPGKPINANEVRRGLVIASSMGLVNVRPTVRASRSNPANLDIIIVTDPPKPLVGLEVNNLNTADLGRWGLLGSIQFNGLTPFYDRTSVGVFQTLGQTGQTTAMATTHILAPVIDSGVGLDFAWSNALPTGSLAPLSVTSNSWYMRPYLDRFLYVRRGLVIHASTGLDLVDQDTDILHGAPLIRDSLRVFYANIDAQGLFAGGVLTGGAEVRQGLNAMGASTQPVPYPSIVGEDPQALVWRANIGYTHPVGPLSVAATLRGQYTTDTLAAFEQMTYGSLNGGWGWDPASIAGDRGVAGTIEVQGPPIKAPLGTAIRPFVFSDAAHITTVQPGLTPEGWAVSVGGGIRVATQKHYSFYVTYADPVEHGAAAPGSYGSRVLFGMDVTTEDLFSRLANLLEKGSRKP
jgi:hemolysin activation/secretion protein